MLRATAGWQDAVDRSFATLSGACDVDDVYTEELLEALAVRGPMSSSGEIAKTRRYLP